MAIKGNEKEMAVNENQKEWLLKRKNKSGCWSKRKKWFLKGKKKNGSEQEEQTRRVIQGKENKRLLKGKKMNGCQLEWQKNGC